MQQSDARDSELTFEQSDLVDARVGIRLHVRLELGERSLSADLEQFGAKHSNCGAQCIDPAVVYI